MITIPKYPSIANIVTPPVDSKFFIFDLKLNNKSYYRCKIRMLLLLYIFFSPQKKSWHGN